MGHNALVIEREAADRILQEARSSLLHGAPLRLMTMRLLSKLPGYDWCGVYRLEGDDLLLDEFVGAPTDHTRIPVGSGVCGTAVAANANQVVDDVRSLTNYLSCSAQTRSEIVVLVRGGEGILGQIDIDGHEVGAFDRSDEELLESLAAILAGRW